LFTCTTQKQETTKMNNNRQKETQTKLTKGLLDMIILQYLEKESMHGYQLITTIRKNFGIYFGPSTIYPLLGTLQKKGYVDSEWEMNHEKPRKVYKLTSNGQTMLNDIEGSLNMICKKIQSTNSSICLEQQKLQFTVLR
jgi:PadR family transcriptional regulator PadR